MKNLLILFVLFLSTMVFGQEVQKQTFYVGTFTDEGGEGIYLCNLNPESGEISLNRTFKGIANPSFLKISEDRNYLYAVSRATPEIEKSGGFVVAYKINENGSLHFLNKQISNGEAPCHVDVSPKRDFVAIAAYGGGTTSLYPLEENGTLKKASIIIVNKAESVEPGIEIQPHAHSIKFSPFENAIFSADLGTDQLNMYRLENGKMVNAEQKFVKLPVGAGPRHFEFHPNGKTIYVINELNSTMSTLKKQNKKWELVQNLSTLPADFKGESYCADVHISADGQYLYGSNRGHNSIAVFKVDEASNELSFIGATSVEGNWPRNFGISPDGNWMLVANQKSGDITVFSINKKEGTIAFTGQKLKIPAAVCIEFL